LVKKIPSEESFSIISEADLPDIDVKFPNLGTNFKPIAFVWD
jgi:hypothetical protein